MLIKVGDTVYLRPLSTFSKDDYKKYPNIIDSMYGYFGKQYTVAGFRTTVFGKIFYFEEDSIQYYYQEWMLGNVNFNIIK